MNKTTIRRRVNRKLYQMAKQPQLYGYGFMKGMRRAMNGGWRLDTYRNGHTPLIKEPQA